MSGAREFVHLDPNYRRFAALPDAERIAWIRADRWIGFDQAGLALGRLENLLTYPARDRMPNWLSGSKRSTSSLGRTMRSLPGF